MASESNTVQRFYKTRVRLLVNKTNVSNVYINLLALVNRISARSEMKEDTKRLWSRSSVI